MVAMLLVSDENSFPFVGLIADKKGRGCDIQRIANSQETKYTFIPAGSEQAANFIIRAFECLADTPAKADS